MRLGGTCGRSATQIVEEFIAPSGGFFEFMVLAQRRTTSVRVPVGDVTLETDDDADSIVMRIPPIAFRLR